MSPIVIGHRGFAGQYPENTLLAISKALELGVDCIEIDIHQTADGQLILMHDRSIDRTTTGKGKVKQLTYDELKAHTIPYPDGEPLHIPTLEEAISLVNGRAMLLIEVKKGGAPGIEANLLALLEKHQAAPWCMVQSFDPKILRRIHQSDADIKLIRLLFMPYFHNFRRASFLEGYAVYHRFISRRLAQKLHAKDQRLFAWTVNRPTDFERMVELGVDGVITDFPDRVK